MPLSSRALLRGLALIAVLAAAGWLLKTFGIAGMLDEAWIDAHVRQNGLTGDVIFIAAASVLAAGGFPRQVISFLAGYLSAGYSKTAKVGTYGGMEFPTVTIFMDGFKQGVD